MIIPTYNRAELVTRAVESVLRQTYTDYELIVVDDGSTDDTRERLEPYAHRVRYHQQANSGASAAQNAGVRIAMGQWVAILGSDDVWESTKLEAQIATVEQLGSGFGACFTNCAIHGCAGLDRSIFEMARLQTTSEYGEVQNPLRYITSDRYALYVQSLLVLRSLFIELDGFDENLRIAEDREFIFRLSFKTRFAYIASPLVRIDRSPGVPRLTDLRSNRADRTFLREESLLSRMLATRELVDFEDRALIREELVNLYYDWATARINDFRLSGIWPILKKLALLGQGRRRIAGRIANRAAAKIAKKLRKQHKTAGL